jgi:hypothetical protein
MIGPPPRLFETILCHRAPAECLSLDAIQPITQKAVMELKSSSAAIPPRRNSHGLYRSTFRPQDTVLGTLKTPCASGNRLRNEFSAANSAPPFRCLPSAPAQSF